MRGVLWITSNGRKVSASASVWLTWISKHSNAPSKNQADGMRKWQRRTRCHRQWAVRLASPDYFCRVTGSVVFYFVPAGSESLRRSRSSASFRCSAGFQRHRHFHVSNLELGGFERGVPVLLPHVPGNCDPDVFPRNLC